MRRWPVGHQRGVWALDTNGSGDGSPTALLFTATSGTGKASRSCSQALFPTHVEFWLYGMHRTYLSKGTTFDVANGLRYAGYRDGARNLIWAGGGNFIGLTLADLHWLRFELRNISWTANTFEVYIDGTRVWHTPTTRPASFGTAWAQGAGLRRIDVSGGMVDGIRMW